MAGGTVAVVVYGVCAIGLGGAHVCVGPGIVRVTARVHKAERGVAGQAGLGAAPTAVGLYMRTPQRLAGDAGVGVIGEAVAIFVGVCRAVALGSGGGGGLLRVGAWADWLRGGTTPAVGRAVRCRAIPGCAGQRGLYRAAEKTGTGFDGGRERTGLRSRSIVGDPTQTGACASTSAATRLLARGGCGPGRCRVGGARHGGGCSPPGSERVTLPRGTQRGAARVGDREMIACL
jgi:hypothetical protein